MSGGKWRGYQCVLLPECSAMARPGHACSMTGDFWVPWAAGTSCAKRGEKHQALILVVLQKCSTTASKLPLLNGAISAGHSSDLGRGRLLREQILYFWASLFLLSSYRAPAAFLNKLIPPHLPAELSCSHKHTHRACTKGLVGITARISPSPGTTREKAGLSCAEQGLGAGACMVSPSPPCCRCRRWRAACLDCAHWLEEYVASTVCSGSVFPGLVAWGMGNRWEGGKWITQTFVGDQISNPAWVDCEVSACPSQPCRLQAVSGSIRCPNPKWIWRMKKNLRSDSEISRKEEPLGRDWTPNPEPLSRPHLVQICASGIKPRPSAHTLRW